MRAGQVLVKLRRALGRRLSRLFAGPPYWQPELMEPGAESALVVAGSVLEGVMGCGGALYRHHLAGVHTALWVPQYREQEAASSKQAEGSRDQGPGRPALSSSPYALGADMPEALRVLGVSEMMVGGVGPQPPPLAAGSWRRVYVPSPWGASRRAMAAARACCHMVAQVGNLRHCKWLVHEAWSPIPANRLVDIAAAVERKRQAIAAAAQMVDDRGQMTDDEGWRPRAGGAVGGAGLKPAATAVPLASDVAEAVLGLSRYRGMPAGAGGGQYEAFLELPGEAYCELVRSQGHVWA